MFVYNAPKNVGTEIQHSIMSNIWFMNLNMDYNYIICINYHNYENKPIFDRSMIPQHSSHFT